jgi:S-adenosylmethionine:tRNA-ribosyltransferase-isomerase (queuine synthetase)
MKSIQLTKTITASDLNSEASGRRKNLKHKKFYAIFVEKELIEEKDLLFSNDPYVMQEALAEFSAFADEAVTNKLHCFFSKRKQRWVFWKAERWNLGSTLEEHGVKQAVIGNRMADYQELVREASLQKKSSKEVLGGFLAAA